MIAHGPRGRSSMWTSNSDDDELSDDVDEMSFGEAEVQTVEYKRDGRTTVGTDVA